MDLSVFDGPSDDGADLTVLHPGTGEPTDMTIKLAGTDSKLWRQARREAGRRAMDSARDGGKSNVLEMSDKTAAFTLSRVTLSWRNCEFNGKSLQCTQENAAMLYEKLPWLREQVDRFVSNRSRFFRPGGPGDTGRSEGTDGAAPSPSRGTEEQE